MKYDNRFLSHFIQKKKLLLKKQNKLVKKMNFENTHGLQGAVTDWWELYFIQRVQNCITGERACSSAIELQLNTLHSSLRPSSVWTQTLKAEWSEEHVLKLMVHMWQRGNCTDHILLLFIWMWRRVKGTWALCTCFITLITSWNSGIHLRWQTGMNINMMKNDSFQEQHLSLCVGIQWCASHSQNPLSNFPACQQKRSNQDWMLSLSCALGSDRLPTYGTIRFEEKKQKTTLQSE